MAPKLLSEKHFKALHIALFTCLVLLSAKLNAQSVLLPGDVVIVSANTDTQSIDFIPLIDIEAGTELYFSRGVWDDSTQSMSGSELSITFLADIEAGSNVHLNAKQDKRFDISGHLKFEGDTHRLFAYQKGNEYYRHIFALGWGTGKVWNYAPEDSASSDIPRSLTNEELYLTLGAEPNHQYFIRNGASGTRDLLLNFVKNEANWRSSNNSFPQFGTSFNLLSPPVILFDKSISVVEETDSIAVLDVAIYEHDGSRLTVDVVFDSTQSIISKDDIGGFTSKMLNFTGLIGDAAYEVHVPIVEDNEFEGRETGIFTLQNLTKGNFGDFLTHSLVINDNEKPRIQILAIYNDQEKGSQIELRNEEGGVISLNGWKLTSSKGTYMFRDDAVVRPAQSLILHDKSSTQANNSYETIIVKDLNEILLNKLGGTIQLIDQQGKVIDIFEYEQIISEEKPNRRVEMNDMVASSGSNQRSAKPSSSTPLQSSALQSESNSAQKEIPGWEAIQASEGISELFPEKSWIVWNGQEKQFQKIGSDVDFSGESQILFGYFESNEADTLRARRLKDKQNKIADQQTVTFRVSASDENENDQIDGLEGLNLLWNPLEESISVKIFKETIAGEFPHLVLEPVMFGFQHEASGELSIHSFSDADSIDAKSPFWLLLNTEQEPVDLVLQKSMLLKNTETVPNEEEGVNKSQLNIRFSLVNMNLNESVEISFADPESMSENLRDLESYPSLQLSGERPYFQAAIHTLEDYFDTFQLSSEIASEVSLPLYFDMNESGSIRLDVTNWQQVPEGWQIKLEDQLLEKEYTLREGFTLNFEHLKNSNNRGEVEANTTPRRNERFVIHFLPPGAAGTEVNENVDIPRELELYQNYPNPFNPITTISFFLPEPEEVKLSVFNIVGQPIAVIVEGTLSAGEQNFEWDARERPSGMYIYQLEVGNKVMTRKMTLVK